jgi:hypothetical protein
MYQVKIFTDFSETDLEEKINEFLSEKSAENNGFEIIKYRAMYNGRTVRHVVHILYKEADNANARGIN